VTWITTNKFFDRWFSYRMTKRLAVEQLADAPRLLSKQVVSLAYHLPLDASVRRATPSLLEIAMKLGLSPCTWLHPQARLDPYTEQT
jgi:hypothetical protein